MKRVILQLTMIVDDKQFSDHEEYVCWCNYVMHPDELVLHSNEIGEGVSEKISEVKILSVEDVSE